VALSFLYRLLRNLIEFARVHRMDAIDKDAEILVLRQQLAVLRRQIARPRLSWSDRALIASLARLVPRERWASFLVTPETILRWRRALVRRHWTYPHRVGRPSLPDETVELILRLARENPRAGATSASSGNFECSASTSLRAASPASSLDQSEPQGRRLGSQRFLGRSVGKGDANDSYHPEGATPFGPYLPCPQPLCCEVLGNIARAA
jgi:hypothetical protein